MTMRQVAGLLAVIQRADLIDFYTSLVSYGTIHGAKLPSLEDFLSASLNKPKQDVPQFDEATDKAFEELAKKRIEERRAHLGK